MKSFTAIAYAQLAPPEPEADFHHEFDEEYSRLKMIIPDGVDIKDAIDYGFYEHKHRYWIARPGGNFISVSNFTMEIKYLIVGAHPKRIVEITNVHGKKATIEMEISDLISMDRFNERTQSVGNFLFEGKSTDLAKIKNKLFNIEKASIEISRLGQHKDRFFTFANGIYDYASKEWLPIDDAGMVMHGPDNFYIPVFGSTTNDDDEDLRNYRKFIHRPQKKVNFEMWSDLLCQVYGDNGKIGIAFAIFAIFSDLIFAKTTAAPMLFLFGQRGSGKGTLANSILSLWGVPQDPLMLGGASTVVGFMRKLAQFSNAIVWLDEYKNDIGDKKIESLKNIWDRVGYERGVKDASNRTQVTSVTSSAILSGQEMPNVEPALFSRTILCEFRAMQRSQEDVNKFDALREMETLGITNCLLEIINHRAVVKAKFPIAYGPIAAQFRQAFAGEEIIERQIVNYATICTCVSILEDKLKFPFNAAELMVISERYLKAQANMMRTANEVQQFFEMLAFLLASKLVENGKDVHITSGLVKVRMTCVFPLYREYGTRQRIKVLDRGTLVNYIENSEAYEKIESKKGSTRFPLLQNPTSCAVFLQDKIKQLYGVDFGNEREVADSQQLEENNTPAL